MYINLLRKLYLTELFGSKLYIAGLALNIKFLYLNNVGGYDRFRTVHNKHHIHRFIGI